MSHTFATIDDQLHALDMLRRASERVLDASATLSGLTTAVASGHGSEEDIAEMGAHAEYLGRMVTERDQVAKFAHDLGTYNLSPDRYRAALRGEKFGTDILPDDEALDAIRTKLVKG